MKKLLFLFGSLLLLGLADTAKAASLELVYPNGGESLKSGETYEFRWDQSDINSVFIYITNIEGTVMQQGVSVSVNPSDTQGAYQYTILDNQTMQGEDNFLVKIIGYPAGENGNPQDQSDAPFTIYRDKPDLVITDFKIGNSGGFSTPDYSNRFADTVLAFTVYVDNEGNNLLNYNNTIEIHIGDIVCRTSYATVVPGYATCSNAIKLDAGTYEATAIIDADDDIEESNEENNTKNVTFEVTSYDDYVSPINECQPIIPRPEGHYHENCVDMIIENISVSPSSPQAGANTTITVTGAVDETGGTVTTDSLNQYDHNFEDFVVDDMMLDAGEPFTIIHDFEYIFTGHFTSTGEKSLYFKVDPMNRKDEISESNNELTKTIAVVSDDSEDDSDDSDIDVKKIIICHLTGNGSSNTLEIAESAWPAHQTHGDTLGACIESDDDSDIENQNKRQKNLQLTNRLKGKILLQVENYGEAWYVRPDNGNRIYMKDGDTAYGMMRDLGLGISNADLAKIPVGIEDRFECTDDDNDGLCNKLEESIGTDPNDNDSDDDGFDDGAEVKSAYNPLGVGKSVYDNSLVNNVKGKIVLQVQSRGEAWYINPDDGRRYYMTDGEAAYQIMRYLSLGITNKDLEQISTE
ncbi:hypothetical protein KKH39_00410 [Patescibacteria group bacterium]|nr:hypothetical protein [Patescibacteria group bacterium]